MSKEQSSTLLKGINLYKEIKVEGDKISFIALDDEAFYLDNSTIKNTNLYNKNEIELNMPIEDFNDEHDVLCDIRFYIPENAPASTKFKETGEDGEEEGDEEEEFDEEGEEEEKEGGESKKDAKIKDTAKPKNTGEMEEEGVESEEFTLAQNLEKQIRGNAKIDENMGELVGRIDALNLVVPRGKYTADLHMNNMKLHGSTFNYKIVYQNVVKAFLLPDNDGLHFNLVLGFNKPLRQGNTKYPYIIFQFKISKEINIELSLSEEKLQAIHKNLKPTYSGPAHEIVAKLFKMIMGVNIIIPGNFKTSQGHPSLKCSVGNQEGNLFLMNKSMIFINKPVIYIRISDVARVEFQRVAARMNMRGFDFEVVLKSGVSTTFSGADKRDLEQVTEYFEKSEVEVKTINEQEKLDAELGTEGEDEEADSIITGGKEDGEGEEEDDDDFVAPDDEKGDDAWGSDDGVDED